MVHKFIYLAAIASLGLFLATFSFAKSSREHLVFKPEKSDDILQHEVEKRGFVSVPLDYAHPDKRRLKIFYRLIPANGHSANDDTTPLMVVVNGGPGFSSNGYRAYGYDYETMPADKLANLTKHFRVLIMDQRGTPGNSTALKMDMEDLDYKAISKYFSADSIARDQEAVINTVLPKGKPFYMIAQSFGGIVGFEYMYQDTIKRKPAGMIFTSPAMPFEDPIQFNLNRRSSQKELNIQLKQYAPDIEKRIDALKKHFAAENVKPTYVNSLWHALGHGKDGEWQQVILDDINKMMKMNHDELIKTIDDSIGQPDMLNIILSSSNMTPGYTDLTLSRKAMKDMPFEPWMLDEFSTNIEAAKGDSVNAKNIRRIDRHPPKPLKIGTPDEVKNAIHQSRVLFSFGTGDAMTPTQPGVDHMLANFYIPGKTSYIMVAGGHQAVFTAEGVKAVIDWIG